MGSTELSLVQLQTLAKQSGVHGQTLACLHALRSTDDEIRMWAAEALESSIEPTVDERVGLHEQLQDLLKQCETVGDVTLPADLVDQTYWCVTMLGRLGETDEATLTVLNRASQLQSTAMKSVRARAAWALQRLKA